MIKPEWGTKRQCPKCNTRFYDLTREDPVTCIACGHAWAPEPILKSKQPLPFEEAKKEGVKEEAEEGALAEEDLDLDEGSDESADEEADLGGEDDLSEVVDPSEDEES